MVCFPPTDEQVDSQPTVRSDGQAVLTKLDGQRCLQPDKATTASLAPLSNKKGRPDEKEEGRRREAYEDE